MAVSAEDADFARELFAGVGPLTTRRMMGGLCLYADGTIFAIVRSDGAILLKGAGAMATRMEADGWEKWDYVRSNGARGAMPYWLLPDDVYDDPDRASALARDALACL
ncbi:TfoX/Sxy family protein [Wenxinia marina]|uniref:Regulator n=1 Tax=Wenxinia marina DSM 24838 TaxID=1123501 RepID=A0A0D0NMN2_9RHOB|nr:TfoX/Sxy family protein [Wenxinia marina]KIQ69565.1 Regulator [Wenxinia marina DSM 24838]GGL59400.1 competence protein TfoX [Wenxinia marina]